MRNLLPRLLVLAATSLPIAAHADTLDATLIGDSHTFTFTLPSPYSFPDQLHLVTIPTITTTGTTDGVRGETFDVTFYSGIGSTLDSLIFNDRDGHGYLLDGPVLISPLLQTGTPPGTDTALIHTGTFLLGDIALSSAAGPNNFVLTITPQSTTTPEPSTLLLFATGMIGLVSTLRHRIRRPCTVVG
jgi:PEP-CTERM motif